MDADAQALSPPREQVELAVEIFRMLADRYSDQAAVGPSRRRALGERAGRARRQARPRGVPAPGQAADGPHGAHAPRGQPGLLPGRERARRRSGSRRDPQRRARRGRRPGTPPAPAMHELADAKGARRECHDVARIDHDGHAPRSRSRARPRARPRRTRAGLWGSAPARRLTPALARRGGLHRLGPGVERPRHPRGEDQPRRPRRHRARCSSSSSPSPGRWRCSPTPSTTSATP